MLALLAMPGTVSQTMKDFEDLGKDLEVYSNFLRQFFLVLKWEMFHKHHLICFTSYALAISRHLFSSAIYFSTSEVSGSPVYVS